MLRFHPIHKRDPWNAPSKLKWTQCPLLNSRGYGPYENPGRYLYPLWISENTYPETQPDDPAFFDLWFQYKTLYAAARVPNTFNDVIWQPIWPAPPEWGSVYMPQYRQFIFNPTPTGGVLYSKNWYTSQIDDRVTINVTFGAATGRQWPIITKTCNPNFLGTPVNQVLRPTYAFARVQQHDLDIYRNRSGVVTRHQETWQLMQGTIWGQWLSGNGPEEPVLVY